MASTTTSERTSPSKSAESALRDKYVARLRARLSRPSISVADARDGMLDCFVSTYHAGVEQGLKGILGVNASPDQVAQVASKMFRDRLGQRGVSFDAPTIDALNEIKDELDQEFHFSELPVEVSATHDQVCSLLLAKADGLIEHHGDRSVVAAKEPAARSRPPEDAAPKRPAKTAAFNPTAVAQSSPRAATSVAASLRQALATYLEEVAQVAHQAAPSELLHRLDRARALAQSIEDFDQPPSTGS